MDQKEEHHIDFRVPGLSHSVVKEAEHRPVQELLKRIETHPHREALRADLQQNNVYNPFTKDSKAMIREMGNVKLFGLCKTTPTVQCSHCLIYWNQGVVHCTCGQCLIYSESKRKFSQTKTGCNLYPGLRDKERTQYREYHFAWNAWKRCCKKVDSKVKHFARIHDRCLSDQVYRESQLAIGWTEQKFKGGMNLRKKTIHTNSLQRKREDTKDNGILL